MPVHARPLPAPARLPGGQNDSSRPEVRLTSPEGDTPATLPTASPQTVSAADVVEHATPGVPSPDRQHEVPVPAARDTPWPWYRGEPWLAVVLAAFVPIVVAFTTPPEFHAPLLGMSALLVILGFAMLIRQGLFREHPRPPHAHDRPTRDVSRRDVARRGEPAGA